MWLLPTGSSQLSSDWIQAHTYSQWTHWINLFWCSSQGFLTFFYHYRHYIISKYPFYQTIIIIFTSPIKYNFKKIPMGTKQQIRKKKAKGLKKVILKYQTTKQFASASLVCYFWNWKKGQLTMLLACQFYKINFITLILGSIFFFSSNLQILTPPAWRSHVP